jgi:hypothetical protein
MSLLRFRLRTLMIAVAVVGLGLVPVSLFFNATADEKLAFIAGHDTSYATGFTEEGWHSLRRGMSTREVERIIGSPLEKHRNPGGTELWNYSRSPGSTHYWVRTVEFRGGTMSQLRSGFYFD